MAIARFTDKGTSCRLALHYYQRWVVSTRVTRETHLYYENNILLCRMPSHSSQELQPLAVEFSGPRETAHRREVELVFILRGFRCLTK